MITGILGKKIGMTQVFDADGMKVPVTVLEAGPCTVQQVKETEKDGYNAVQMGYDDTKEKRLKKPQREYVKAKKIKPKKFVGEIRCAEKPDVKVGDEITIKMFQTGDYLDITGISKGKGFQGGMKRCGWSGGKKTHGSMSHRVPGSIGASAYPSRVVKGHGMPGQMGQDQVTVQNIEVVDVNRENNTIAVKGAVPGAPGTFLVIRYAKKKTLAEREVIEEEEVAEEQPEVEAKPEEKAPEVKEEAPKEESKSAAEPKEAEKPKEEAPKEDKAESKQEEKKQ